MINPLNKKQENQQQNYNIPMFQLLPWLQTIRNCHCVERFACSAQNMVIGIMVSPIKSVKLLMEWI